jgi:hypothetical protein
MNGKMTWAIPEIGLRPKNGQPLQSSVLPSELYIYLRGLILASCQLALYTFVTPLASSIMAPSLPDLAIKYGITNPTVTALTLSIFLLSFAIGPLFAAPLTEVYGRVWVRYPPP